MSFKMMTIGAALLLAVAPVTGQERGTIEFGVYGNNTSFEDDIRLNDSWGGGGRVGAFVLPWLSLEAEFGHKSASRPFGLADVGVEAFAARILTAPLTYRAAHLLVGAGLIHTDWEVGESDGIQGLLGIKYDLGNYGAFRFEALMDFNRDDVHNTSAQLGVSLYRHAIGGFVGD